MGRAVNSLDLACHGEEGEDLPGHRGQGKSLDEAGPEPRPELESWRQDGAVSIKGQTRSEDGIVVERGEPHQKAGLIGWACLDNTRQNETDLCLAFCSVSHSRPQFSERGPRPAAAAILGSLSEMPLIRPHPRPAQSHTTGMGPGRCVSTSPPYRF